MECERFKKLLKSWYIQVQNELLAPARMVDFMETHVADCPVCLMDPEAKKDITKIITLVLPQDKLKQTIRNASTGEHDETVDDIDDAGLGVDEEEVVEEDDEAEGDDIASEEGDEVAEDDDELDEEPVGEEEI
jgi:hypothetical protein